MIKRSTVFNFRCDLTLLDEIESLVKDPHNPNGVFQSTSEVIRECVKVGLKVHNYQEMMKDPEKAEEFRKKMQEMIENEEMDKWADTLSSQQLDGVVTFLRLKQDARFKVSKLV